MAGTRILVVEDESSVAAYIVELLETLGYKASTVVRTGEEAIRVAAKSRPALALIDITLKGDLDGVETGERIHNRFNMPVVYLTDRANEDLLKRAKITEPFGYVLKPVEERRLHLNIEIALYRHETERRFMEREQWLIYYSQKYRRCCNRCRRRRYGDFHESSCRGFDRLATRGDFGKAPGRYIPRYN